MDQYMHLGYWERFYSNWHDSINENYYKSFFEKEKFIRNTSPFSKLLPFIKVIYFEALFLNLKVFFLIQVNYLASLLSWKKNS